MQSYTKNKYLQNILQILCQWAGTLWRTLLVMFFTMIVAYALIVAILIIFYVK